MTDRLTLTEARAYAARAVQKIDLLGPDGAEACTALEIEGLAMIAKASGLLPVPGQDQEPKPVFKSRRSHNGQQSF